MTDWTITAILSEFIPHRLQQVADEYGVVVVSLDSVPLKCDTQVSSCGITSSNCKDESTCHPE